MLRTGILLPRTEDLPQSEVVEFVQRVDALGYDTLWVPEAWGRDAFTILAQIACHTRQVKLGTGIVNVFSRTPAALAQTIATLDEISGGRAVLGLGTSGAIVIQDWHGVPYDKPLQRTREYIDIVRLILSGERVNYDGQLFHLKSFRLPFKPVRGRVPIYVASLGPKNVRLTGEKADGWLPIYYSRTRGHVQTQDLEEGARAAGRSLKDVDVAPYLVSCVSEDVAAARALVRAQITYYVGGMGVYYNNLVRRYGFVEESARIKEMWAKGDRKAAAAAVSDALLDDVGLAGSPAQVRAKLEEYRARGVTMPIIAVAHNAARDMVRTTLETFAPKAVKA